MAISSAVAIDSSRASGSGRRGIARVAIAVAGALAILGATGRATEAQTAAPEKRSTWEFLVSSGKVVPTGAQRDALKAANLTAAQLSYLVRPSLAITGMVGWARSRDIASEGDPKLDVFTYDLGAEVRTLRLAVRGRLTASGFAGLGAGGRSYNYRSLDVDATHNLAAYGSIGGEVGLGRVSVRMEARDYVSGFKSLDGGAASETRNDVALLAGLRIRTR